MPWIQRSVKEAAMTLDVYAGQQYTELVASLEGRVKVRGGAYSLLQTPCTPFEVFLQWGFGNSHLAFSLFGWGFVYAFWFFLFYQPELTGDYWPFWPTAGVLVAALCWLHSLYGFADKKSMYGLFQDHVRPEGTGTSIPWALLVFLLSIFVRSLRAQLRYPVLRKRWYRFMDHAITLIGHWFIAWHLVNYLLDTNPHPDWLAYVIVGCLYYYAARNVILIFVVAAKAAGIQSMESMRIETLALAKQNLEMLDELHANEEAQSKRDQLIEERRKGPSIIAVTPSRVVPKPKPNLPTATFCGNCGVELSGTKFCTACGTRIGGDDD